MESIAQLLQLIPRYEALPEMWRTLIPILVSCALFFGLLCLVVLFLVWLERKISAHIQDRLGPMYVGGWHGWAQTLADALKLLLKEDIVPGFCGQTAVQNGAIHRVSRRFCGLCSRAFRRLLVCLRSEYWNSLCRRARKPLGDWNYHGRLGVEQQVLALRRHEGGRADHQLRNPGSHRHHDGYYSVGSLSMVDIVNAQRGGIQNWFLFRNPFTFLAFFIYFIASLAEVNRTPFDIPEAESELVAGFHTEYSGMRFAFFFLAEYANMLLVTCVATTLFLGGWTQVLPGPSQLIPGPIMFFLKAFAIIFVQMWLRWSVPRLRVDQLMYLSWKVLLPISFVLVLGAGWLAVC